MRVIGMRDMENNGTPFIVSIERFKPNWFHLEQGEGLFKSHSHAYDERTLILDGEGYYSAPEQNVKVVAGDLIMIPPGLYHGFVCTEPWQGTGQGIIQEVLKEIHSAYYTPITVSELASRHFLSASNLRKKFTETVGVTPKQYIINLRLMEAKRLLQQTNEEGYGELDFLILNL
jgi:hypothetical protein